MLKKILQRMFILAVIIIGLLTILITGLYLVSSQYQVVSSPMVSIHSPGSGTEIGLGETITINSTSWDEDRGITSVELWVVQGNLLTLLERTAILEGKNSISLSQGWQPHSLGSYRLIVRAFNDQGNSGQAAVDLTVIEEPEDESIAGEVFPTSPEGGFEPIEPDPAGDQEGGDPSPPPPDPNPNPPLPPIPFQGVFNLLLEPFLPILNGTFVEVEALAFQVQEQYDELHCFVGLGNYPPERVPELGSFQVSSLYSWNLEDYLGGNNKAVVFVPDNESLDVYLDCRAFRQNNVITFWPGEYTKEHPPADWTGQVIVGNSDNGEGFTVSYRINPVGGALLPPTNFNQFTFNNRIYLNWTWEGDENEIDGFKIFRGNSHVATAYWDQRTIQIPPWWIVPPCGEEFNYTIVTYKEELQSAASNYLSYQGAVCGGEDGVTSLDGYRICGGTGQRFYVDYRYQSPHGAASIGLQAFNDGELITAIHSTRVPIQHGEGSAQLAMTYHGPDPIITDQISVIFYDHTNMPFYAQTFDKVFGWEPGSPDLSISSARVNWEHNQLRIKIKNSGCALPAVQSPTVSIKREADGWTGFQELGRDLPPRTEKIMTLDLDPNDLEDWAGEINLEVDPFNDIPESLESNNTYQIAAARIKQVQIYGIYVYNDHDRYSKGEWVIFPNLIGTPNGIDNWEYINLSHRDYRWGKGFHDINNCFFQPNIGSQGAFGLNFGGWEEDGLDPSEDDWLGDIRIYHSADGNPIPQMQSWGYQLMDSWKSGGEYSVLSDKGDYKLFYRIILE